MGIGRKEHFKYVPAIFNSVFRCFVKFKIKGKIRTLKKTIPVDVDMIRERLRRHIL